MANDSKENVMQESPVKLETLTKPDGKVIKPAIGKSPMRKK